MKENPQYAYKYEENFLIVNAVNMVIVVKEKMNLLLREYEKVIKVAGFLSGSNSHTSASTISTLFHPRAVAFFFATSHRGPHISTT